ncbi:MAG: DUF3244 domain-containing protein [Bacteroidaceae bacterium]|nr:DUF3244 domain-containing protein [Bacteroidaceae bacterium]
MKKTLSIICSLFVFLTVYGQGNNIVLSTEEADTIGAGHNGNKELVLVPVASLERSILQVSFPVCTVSQVVIIDKSSNQTVYSDSFASTTQVIIDLEDEGLGEGNYLLRIYAFGKWWWGEFVLEEE